MHTLSVFPSLLTYSQASALLIRLVLGAILIHWAYQTYRGKINADKKWLAIADAIVGIALVIGLWTQVAALLLALDLIYRIVKKIRTGAFLTDGVNYYLILLILAISLMLTGPGFYAFDLAL